MTVKDELMRARARGDAQAINRRHRAAREAQEKMRAALRPPTPPSGLHPDFAAQLGAAKKRAKAALDRRGDGPDTQARIDRLRAAGVIAPENPDGVGYEPTAEEVLGELAEPAEPISDPEQVESVPTAEEVLSAPRGDEETAVGETEPLTHQQLNPALRGALQQAAVETARRLGNTQSKGKKHKR